MSTSVVHGDGFSVTTRIKSSPQELYRAWTDPAAVQGWLADIAEIDASVDGKYVLRWPADGDVSARGIYLELIPGERIVQTWESWGAQGRFEGGDATIEIEFRDLGDGTAEMTQRESGPSYNSEEKIEMSIRGTIQAHAALASFIEQTQQSS